MTNAPTLYDEDFVAWTEQQAEALRAVAQGGTNQPLDWENLAEEIESLGKSDRRELRSQIYRMVRDLAKPQFSPAIDPRRGWMESVIDGRVQAELVVADSPSLQPQVGQIVSEQTAKALKQAIFDLGELGEIDATIDRALRRTRYTVDQVLGDWFPEGASGSAGAKEPQQSR